MSCANPWCVLSAWFLVAGFALPAQVEVITEARVRETVGWLAADERRGRDTGSPELEQAAEWLAAQFAAGGLRQVKEDTWFHEYALPGVRIDSREITLKLVRKLGDEEQEIVLQPDADVRLWRPADAIAGKDEECTVALATNPVLQRMLDAASARRVVVAEVATDHPYWLQAAGVRSVLGGRRAAARPVFLVRESLLPPDPQGDREAAWTASYAVAAAEKVDVRLRNVVALLPGTSKKDEYVVVSAHYDHIGIGNPVAGDPIYNGADDDASGTTAVLLLACAMAKMPAPRRSILFVCFSAEERGLKGSAAFVERPPVPREQIVANINLEMLGRPEPGKAGQAWITGADYSDFASIAGPALQRGGIELVDFKMATQLFAASDNYSFVKSGIVAHSLSAGSLHADYHQPSDEAELLDIPHMTKVIRALVEVVREFADRDAPPVWSARGEKLRRK